MDKITHPLGPASRVPMACHTFGDSYSIFFLNQNKIRSDKMFHYLISIYLYLYLYSHKICLLLFCEERNSQRQNVHKSPHVALEKSSEMVREKPEFSWLRF